MAHEILLNTGDGIDEADLQTAFAAMGQGYIEQDALDIQYFDSDDTIDTTPALARVPNNNRDIPLFVDAFTGYPLEANAVNNVWLVVDSSAATDDEAVGLQHNTTGVAPSNPSLKIAEVDTNQSGASAVTLLNRGTAPSLAGSDMNPRTIGAGTRLLSLDTAEVSGRDWYPASFADIPSSITSAESAGGGTVHAPAAVGTIDSTIEVPPGVTLHLPAGCVIEPTGQFDMVQLRGAGGVSTESIGRLTGPGMLRTRPDKLTQSSITGFDGVAHILVDGADDIRPSRDDPRGTAEKAVDGVKIMADTASTGGYGIHLDASGQFEHIWYQDFNVHSFGCEHAIRMEATGADSATLNGNTFTGNYVKPVRVINDVLGSESANAISGNELRASAQASAAMDQMYHIEGQNWQRTGYDFDIGRPATYVHFASGSNGNYFGAGSSGGNAVELSTNNGVRNTVEEPAIVNYNSSVRASLQSDTSIGSASDWVTVQFDGVHRDTATEYDSSIYRYRAETAGRVAVDATITCKQAASQTAVPTRIAKNGSVVLSEVHQLPASTSESFGISTTVEVVQSDEIDVRVNPANDIVLSGATFATVLTVEKVA